MRLTQENGSVTAELAVTLPVVGFMLAVIVGVFGMQVQRLQLAADAATAARAVARGESTWVAEQLVRKANRTVEFTSPSDLICAAISQPVALAGLPKFDLTEHSCARKAGF
ncbi:MAG: hypothetical protein WCO24_02985 [Actinomycetes bacterium]